MIKKIAAFILILTYLNTGLVSAKPNKINTPEDFVRNFLCSKMNTLVSRNIDDIDKYFSNKSENSQKYLLFTKQNLLNDYLIAYATNDYLIEKVVPYVKIISSIVKSDITTVEANLKTDIYWNASNALGKPIVGTKCENHILILGIEDNEWKILADKYMTDRGHSDEAIQKDLARFNDTVEKLKKEVQDSIDISKRSKPTKLTLTFSELYNKSTSTSPSINEKANEINPRGLTTYNRDGAYNWAHTYWQNYSTAYVNLGDQTWEGGDCTNFISQCLKAGGANNDKTGHYQWYYDSKGTSNTKDDSYSWTWGTARGFNYILLGNYRAKEYGPKGTEKIIDSDAQYDSSLGQFLFIGDLIQYEWAASSNIKHTAIIVDMVYNSTKGRYEPVISTHTADSWYLPWTKNAYKTHFIHITDIK